MSHQLGTDSLEFVDERLCLCGNVKPPCPPIVRIPNTLDESRFLETVDDPAQGDRLQVEHVGKLDLS